MTGFDTVSSRRVNKRCGKRKYQYVAFITLRDNSRRYPRLVMRLLRDICRKYNARRWGRKIKTDKTVHVHAIIVSEKKLDRNDIVKMCKPYGIRAWIESLNGKPSSVLRKRIKYIRSSHNRGIEIGSKYTIELAYRVLYFQRSSD